MGKCLALVLDSMGLSFPHRNELKVLGSPIFLEFSANQKVTQVVE
jgi:hypothetical protein